VGGTRPTLTPAVRSRRPLRPPSVAGHAAGDRREANGLTACDPRTAPYTRDSPHASPQGNSGPSRKGKTGSARGRQRDEGPGATRGRTVHRRHCPGPRAAPHTIGAPPLSPSPACRAQRWPVLTHGQTQPHPGGRQRQRAAAPGGVMHHRRPGRRRRRPRGRTARPGTWSPRGGAGLRTPAERLTHDAAEGCGRWTPSPGARCDCPPRGWQTGPIRHP
jgi:hypothetical protein